MSWEKSPSLTHSARTPALICINPNTRNREAKRPQGARTVPETRLPVSLQGCSATTIPGPVTLGTRLSCWTLPFFCQSHGHGRSRPVPCPGWLLGHDSHPVVGWVPAPKGSHLQSCEWSRNIAGSGDRCWGCSRPHTGEADICPTSLHYPCSQMSSMESFGRARRAPAMQPQLSPLSFPRG